MKVPKLGKMRTILAGMVLITIPASLFIGNVDTVQLMSAAVALTALIISAKDDGDQEGA